MLDLNELPEKYRFNEEPLTEGKYIDDNSLFVYWCISRGMFSHTLDGSLSFLYLQPFEWTSIDFASFLLTVSKNYGFGIENVKTMILAMQDEYEVSSEPREYEGAYKWILELKETAPDREEVVLFERFATDTATTEDVERALIYANRIAPMYKDESSELYLSKDLFKKVLDYTSFFIAMDTQYAEKLKRDVEQYLNMFIEEKLVRNSRSKTIGNTSVSQSENIFTFKKHALLFREYLQKMQEDFGDVITIESPFEEKFPNIIYPENSVIRSRYAKRNFYFIHTLLAFKKLGLVKVLALGSNWDMYEESMLTYQSKIEILPVFHNEEASKKLHFDADKSRFYVQGKAIRILKFKDEYQTLRILFENPNELSQEWFFSDIAERIDDSNLDDKKYYNAIYQIRLKLEKEGIKDLFITTKQSVKINGKYLS